MTALIIQFKSSCLLPNENTGAENAGPPKKATTVWG